MRILITGINSALGIALAESLTQHEVVGLAKTRHPKYPTVLCNLGSPLPSLPAVDVCVHLASITDPGYCREHYEEAYEVNVAATMRLLKAAPRLVYVSTGSVYGFRDCVLKETMTPKPEDAYAILKRLAEEKVRESPNSAVLRYFFPYGPGTKAGTLVNRLIAHICNGKEVDLNVDGGPRINPMYVADTVALTRMFCLENMTGVFNVAGNEVVSVRELAEMIGRAVGKRVKFRPTGRTIKDMVADTTKCDKLLRPTVNLDNGIRATVEFSLKAKEQCA
jgi:UDP-glucose 4-epimerase